MCKEALLLLHCARSAILVDDEAVEVGKDGEKERKISALGQGEVRSACTDLN